VITEQVFCKGNSKDSYSKSEQLFKTSFCFSFLTDSGERWCSLQSWHHSHLTLCARFQKHLPTCLPQLWDI